VDIADDPAEPETDLYAQSPGLMRVPMGNGTELVYCPYDRTRHLVSASDAGVLQACRDFSTLQDHARRGLEAGKLDEPAIRSSMRRLVEARLLITQRDLVARCLAAKPADPMPARIASLCVPTRNRPAMLARCLESYIECAKVHSRQIRFVIADSSDDASMCRSNVELLTALKKKYAVEIEYLGAGEKRALAQQLAARGVARDPLDFALLNPESCPIDVGANRNALLLDTVGECTVQVDDDTICRVTPWSAAIEGVRFTSKIDPTEFVFMDEGESIPAERFERHDFFALHESLLGASAAELIERHGVDAETFDRPTARFFRRTERGSAKIGLTALGVAGDSGMGTSSGLVQFDSASRPNLIRSERVYRNALANHRMIRAVTRPTVSDGGYCMALNLGLDNRRLLPPFMPVNRGEDDIFGALLKASAEGSCVGYVPWSLAHEPAPRQRPAIGARSARLSAEAIVQMLIREFGPLDSKSPEGNLVALGNVLCDVGRGPIEAFSETVRLFAWRRASQQIAWMEQLLQKHRRLPQFWASDVDRIVATLKASVAATDYIVPRELEEAFGANAASTLMQRLVLRLGELLRVWPELRDGARQLRARGTAIGRPI
jgi:hypothetical protein